MSILIIVFILVIGYLLYTMLESYRSLERELREIRVKCIGTPNSEVASADPGATIKKTLVSGLTRIMNAAS
jgi:hypothetical protein